MILQEEHYCAILVIKALARRRRTHPLKITLAQFRAVEIIRRCETKFYKRAAVKFVSE